MRRSQHPICTHTQQRISYPPFQAQTSRAELYLTSVVDLAIVSFSLPDKSCVWSANGCTVTAVFHHLAPRSTVIGIDHIEQLVEQSKKNLEADGIELGAVEGGIQIIHGDGREGMFSYRSQHRRFSEPC